MSCIEINGYTEEQQQRKIPLNVVNPPPLHSWWEYYRGKQLLGIMDQMVACQKQDKYFLEEWQQLTIRVQQFEDKHYNHL
jgi:hypothetical protein